MLRPYIVPHDPRHPRDANPAPASHPQVNARLFRRAGRLEPAPLERDRGALRPAPQSIRPPAVPPARDAPAGEVEQRLDHVAAGASPPIRPGSIRTCGAPSGAGGRGLPPLPPPPP